MSFVAHPQSSGLALHVRFRAEFLWEDSRLMPLVGVTSHLSKRVEHSWVGSEEDEHHFEVRVYHLAYLLGIHLA